MALLYRVGCWGVSIEWCKYLIFWVFVVKIDGAGVGVILILAAFGIVDN